MPIFEYTCQSCGRRYEEIVLGTPRAPRCPACGSEEAERQHSTFAAATGRSHDPVPAAGPCGRCGDPRGPGACRLD